VRSDAALLALDRATRAIAGELDLDRVLQLIVDSVRELVAANYAALGIVRPDGSIERFFTSGISTELRTQIGALPRGHGLRGTIIRDGVSLRIPDISNHPDTYGFPDHHPAMHCFLGVPVRIGSKVVGNLYLTEKDGADEFSPEDQRLVELFALHAGIAIQNAELHFEVQKLAIVDERLRISRDLHDGIIQSIYAVSLSLEDVSELIPADPAAATSRVDRAIDRLHTTIGDIRTMIIGLGPEVDGGLGAAIEAMVIELLTGCTVEIALDLSGAAALQQRLHPHGTYQVLQIAREAVSNVVRHSGAQRGWLSLAVVGDEAILKVEDDGVGFDPAQRLGSGHFGLANLRNRAAGLAGTLAIESQPALGTRIIVRLPLASSESPT
jgi:two-component system, NarL family, sensor histidine kinase DevS